MQQKIVITGGPSTGKSTIINHLIEIGYTCMPEISREVITKAQEEGIEQLFLTDPLLFSKMLLEGRIQQYINACKMESSCIFFDRGIPDVQAYLNYVSTPYPDIYRKSCHLYKYEKVFIMPPWEDIHVNDKERYEDFEQSIIIYQHLKKNYKEIGYTCIEVPIGSIEARTHFILENSQLESTTK